MKWKKYTSEQIDFLEMVYQYRPISVLTTAFNSIFGETRETSSIRAALRNRRIVSGRTGRFKKGCRPHNKGIKGWQAGGGAKKTQFKKGSIPKNRKPLGSERINRKDGYIMIKVAEPNPHTGFPTRYKPKHVHVYERVHGPVPQGMIVTFRDGDKLNTDIDNLELISREENMRRNSIHNLPEELKDVIRIRGVLNRRINERAGKNEK